MNLSPFDWDFTHRSRKSFGRIGAVVASAKKQSFLWPERPESDPIPSFMPPGSHRIVTEKTAGIFYFFMGLDTPPYLKARINVNINPYQNMKPINSIAGAAACVSLVLTLGCSPMRYSEFSGTKVWAVAAGSMAEKQFALPVYRGWPERPYKVIGSLRFVDANKYWDDGIISMAASTAKHKGGDAIIMRSGSEYGVGMTTGAIGDPKVFTADQPTALVIKWKADTEVAAEKALLNQFTAGFKQRHPELSPKRELVIIAAEYIQWLGLSFDSPAAAKVFDEALIDVLNNSGEKSSRWLFHGSVRASSLASSSSDAVYGIATVNRNGEGFTIVSTSEKSELSFSGSLQEGRLSGQLGFSAGPTIISAKAEGVFTETKISLTGQGHTADGTFQGSFSFNR